MTSWIKKFKEVPYDENILNYVMSLELLKYKQAIIPTNFPEPIPEPILVPLQMYEGVRPGTAPTQNYNTDVQFIKYRRYYMNNRPSTR